MEKFNRPDPEDPVKSDTEQRSLLHDELPDPDALYAPPHPPRLFAAQTQPTPNVVIAYLSFFILGALLAASLGLWIATNVGSPPADMALRRTAVAMQSLFGIFLCFVLLWTPTRTLIKRGFGHINPCRIAAQTCRWLVTSEWVQLIAFCTMAAIGCTKLAFWIVQ
jgi:hypothetical protein